MAYTQLVWNDVLSFLSASQEELASETNFDLASEDIATAVYFKVATTSDWFKNEKCDVQTINKGNFSCLVGIRIILQIFLHHSCVGASLYVTGHEYRTVVLI